MKTYTQSIMASLLVTALLCSGAGASAAASSSSPQSTSTSTAQASQDAYESRLDAIIARGYILVGTTGDYKPFTYLNPETHELEGYDIDAMKQFAESLGVEVRFVQTTWPTLMSDLLADKFDIAAGGITRNTARAKTASLSDPYLSFGKSPLIRAADKEKYKSLEDINKPEVRIGVNPGGTNQAFVNQYLPNATVTVVEKNLDIPGMIADGTFDVMITDNIEAIVYAKADPRLYAALADDTFTQNVTTYMTHRGDPIFSEYLNLWIDEMKLQGKFDELYEKWIK